MLRIGKVGDLVPTTRYIINTEGLAKGEAIALATFPAQLADEAGTHFEDTLGFFALFMAQPGHQRTDRFWLEVFQQIRRHDGFSQPRGRNRRNGIHMNVFASTFLRQTVGQPGQTQLGSTVVGLTKVTVEAGCRGRHDDAAIALLTHDRPSRMGDAHGTFQMDFQHQVPVLLRHLGKTDVTQDAGIVDHDVHSAKVIQRGLYYRLAVFHRVIVGNRLPSHGPDLIHHLVCGRRRLAITVGAATQVVNHHLAATRGQGQSMLPTQPAPGTGDNGYTIIKTKFCHDTFLFSIQGTHAVQGRESSDRA